MNSVYAGPRIRHPAHVPDRLALCGDDHDVAKRCHRHLGVNNVVMQRPRHLQHTATFRKLCRKPPIGPSRHKQYGEAQKAGELVEHIKVASTGGGPHAPTGVSGGASHVVLWVFPLSLPRLPSVFPPGKTEDVMAIRSEAERGRWQLKSIPPIAAETAGWPLDGLPPSSQ